MKNTMKRIAPPIAVALAALTVAGCATLVSGGSSADEIATVASYGLVTPQQAAVIIAEQDGSEDLVLLDIRTDGEIEAAHIPGAVSLDFYSPTFRDDLARLDRELTYLIYCRTGNRTGQTYRVMQDLGFENVYDMDGGITHWINLGYPVCQGSLDAGHTCSGEFPIVVDAG